jgi:type IV pilus assembly protein PilW
MKPNNQHSNFYQAGFSLVEIMVGLVIGLLATLVVLQVFSVFEGQKRTTTGTADAQTNGNVALYSIKRDLQMAGYGLLPITDSPLECTAPNYDTADTGITTLAPVTITDGGTAPGASDIITIRYGTSATGGSFSKVSDIGTAGANVATVDDYLGCNVNDIAIVISGTGGGLCSLTTVAALSAAPNYKGVTLTNVSTMGTANGAFLSCLGNWKEIQYSINPNYNPTNSSNSQAYLQRKETTFPIPAAGNPPAVPSIVDIVNIQAQYGISATPSSNQIIRWVNAKNLVDWNTAVDGASTGIDWGTNLTDANRNLIKAVRIAVVARNGLLEKTAVTSACSSIQSNTPTGLCAWEGSSAGTTPASWAPVIDLSNDPDWARYRYRVYETMIPLRNVIWSKSTL